jgi:hypothetical protein
MTRVPVLFSMAKSKDATRESETHFEQVPIDVVKKIAEQDVSRDKKTGVARVGAEPTSRKKAEPQSAPARSIDRS